MSVKVSHLVWEYADLKGSPLIVLLAMADFADDDGSNVYPSRVTLAQKARVDEKTVSRILTDLENARIITCTEKETGRKGRYRNYTINLENLIPPEFVEAYRAIHDRSENKTGGQNVPRSKTEGQLAPKRETNPDQPGDNLISRIENHPRPVLNPPLARDAGSAEGADAARSKWRAVRQAFEGNLVLTTLAMGIPRLDGEQLIVAFVTPTALEKANAVQAAISLAAGHDVRLELLKMRAAS